MLAGLVFRRQRRGRSDGGEVSGQVVVVGCWVVAMFLLIMMIMWRMGRVRGRIDLLPKCICYCTSNYINTQSHWHTNHIYAHTHIYIHIDTYTQHILCLIFPANHHQIFRTTDVVRHIPVIICFFLLQVQGSEIWGKGPVAHIDPSKQLLIYRRRNDECQSREFEPRM